MRAEGSPEADESPAAPARLLPREKVRGGVREGPIARTRCTPAAHQYTPWCSYCALDAPQLAEMLEKPVAEIDRKEVVNAFNMAKKRLKHLFEIVEQRYADEENGAGSSSSSAMIE